MCFDNSLFKTYVNEKFMLMRRCLWEVFNTNVKKERKCSEKAMIMRGLLNGRDVNKNS